jgi:creatinine amidohydrolase/Fe(II)-dependent formamide hydrolase-like protein
MLFSTSFLFAQDPPPAGQAAPSPAGRQGGRGGRGPALPPIDPPKEWLSDKRPTELLEFDMMTWPEVYDAIHHQGKTVALYYTGGTEHRGPQNVNGGHTLMARETAKEIARRLGNAIVLPVIPYSVNNAGNQQTGTLGLTNDIQAAMTEQICEQAIATGFTTVVILNDHGGGVSIYGEVAKKLEEKYRAPELAPKNIHVFYADHVYQKAQDDFEASLVKRGLPTSSHAGIQDTSEMMYLGKGKNWVRTDLIKYGVTMGPGYVPAPPAPRGQGGGQAGGGGRGAGRGAGRAPVDPSAPRIVASGVSGDARQSSEALGKEAFENKVNQAVEQIKEFLGTIK